MGMSRSTTPNTRASAPAAPALGLPHMLRAAAPDRDARAFLRLFNTVSRRSFEGYPIERLRQFWRLLALALGRRDRVAQVIEHKIDGPAGPLDVRVFMPFGEADAPRPAFIWYHGGGFMVGGLDTADSICRAVARSGCIAVAVRYRLAPEHDLLAGRADCLAALEWIADHGGEWGIDTSRLAIGGDSAGGNLTAALAQAYTRGRGTGKGKAKARSPLRLQVLAYPATELVDAFDSATQNESGYMVTAAMLNGIKDVIGEVPNATDPWLSPRRCEDLRGLPPALVISAGFDPIRDDGIEYATRLRAAGVPVELLHYAGQFHGFLNFDALLASAGDALERIGAALSTVFAGGAASDRTVELSDDPAQGTPALPGAEAAAAVLMAWEGTGLWAQALARLAVPGGAPLTGLLARAWTLPARLARQGVPALSGRLQARQTYPVDTADMANTAA